MGFEAVRSLLAGDRPEASWVGIGLSIFTLLTMSPLAIAKGRIGEALGSSATKSEGRQNMLCAYLSAASRAKERGAVGLRSARFSLPQKPSHRLPALSLC